jgi:hypothetical protein
LSDQIPVYRPSLKKTEASRRRWMQEFLAQMDRYGVEQLDDCELVTAVRLAETQDRTPAQVAREFWGA